jgi:hypothetical protein
MSSLQSEVQQKADSLSKEECLLHEVHGGAIPGNDLDQSTCHRVRKSSDRWKLQILREFESHIFNFSAVQFWVGEVRHGRQDLRDDNRMERLPLDDLDAKILAILHKALLELARSMAQTVRVGLATVL